MSGAINATASVALLALALLASPLGAAEITEAPAQPPAASSPFPLQLEITLPHAPSAFASAGRQRLLYELVLRNFESRTVELQQVAVLDASNAAAPALAIYEADELPALLRRVGGRTGQPASIMPAGGSATMYLLLSFAAGATVPPQLRHHVRTSAGEVLTAAFDTSHDVVQVVGALVTGNNWLAETGLSNDNGHRRGNLLLQGHSVISRRYAFDWVQVENGAMHAGDSQSNAAYYGYGEALVAVADGTVVSVVDSVAENIPGSPRSPGTLQDIPGNNIVLDIGKGQYAHYMHMQQGSARVAAGSRVKRGQVLGAIGNSGDSFAPHLHFEITNSPQSLAGEGLPYAIESFTVLDGNAGSPGLRQAELPLEKALVDFGT